MAAGVVWFATNLRRSRVGRALAAGRDSDAAARSLGIDPGHYRLVALAFSAVVAALGGIVAAYGDQPLDPTRFAIFLSVQYFLYTVVGGAGSLAGAAVVVFAFEVAPALAERHAADRPGPRPGARRPGGRSPRPRRPVAWPDCVQRAVGRLAPAPAAAPVPASVGAGFTGIRRRDRSERSATLTPTIPTPPGIRSPTSVPRRPVPRRPVPRRPVPRRPVRWGRHGNGHGDGRA